MLRQYHAIKERYPDAIIFFRLGYFYEMFYQDAEDASAHPILMVTGCELLARYRIGLQPFYEVLTGHSMVILVCSAEDATYDPAGRLPAVLSPRF